MWKSRFAIALAAVVLVIGSAHFSALTATILPELTPLIGEVLSPPRPVPGSDGRTHLVYELRLSNVMDRPAF